MPSDKPILRSSRPRLWAVIRLFFLAGLAGGVAPLTGQSARPPERDAGTLIVRVHDKATPLPGAFVRSGRMAAVADSVGEARLELAGGLTRVLVTHAGYRPWSFEITIVPDAPQTVEADLTPRDEWSDVPVASTRNGARRDEEPIQVEVASGRVVAHATQLHPKSLIKLLDGAPLVRAQAEPGPLGGARFRVRGLDGRYLGILTDGLPLLGGAPSTFSLLQLSPFDVERAELVSGLATALHGAAGMGGVLNLVSRSADRDSARLAINQSSEKGGDVMFWGARRFSPTTGATLTADFHQQRLVDADDDQWGEFPRSIRLAVRPRLFLDRPNGDGLFATAGVLSEDRTGGFLLSNTDDDPYREELRTRRVDLGVRARRLSGHTGRFEVRLAGMLQTSAHRFDDLRESYRRTALFGEATYQDLLGDAHVVAGVAYQRDGFGHRQLAAFDYVYSVPSVFGQVTLAPTAAVRATLSGRCDHHNIFGTFCTPRISVLAQSRTGMHARLGLATGYYAPNPLDSQSEVLGLHAIVPSGINFERGRGATLDVGVDRGRVRLTGQLGFFHITRPVQLIPFAGDAAGRLRLVNADGPVRVFSGLLSAIYQVDPVTVTAFYEHLDGSESVPGGAGRRDLGHTPRHTLGFDVIWRGPPSGTWAEVRTVYTGAQSVWDNPSRTRTPGYTAADLILSQPMGRARLYVSAENLLDVKLRKYEPVLLAVPEAGGRRTTAPWTMLQGRVVSFGAMVEW